jgi:hypothetical protein
MGKNFGLTALKSACVLLGVQTLWAQPTDPYAAGGFYTQIMTPPAPSNMTNIADPLGLNVRFNYQTNDFDYVTDSGTPVNVTPVAGGHFIESKAGQSAFVDNKGNQYKTTGDQHNTRSITRDASGVRIQTSQGTINYDSKGAVSRQQNSSGQSSGSGVAAHGTTVRLPPASR